MKVFLFNNWSYSCIVDFLNEATYITIGRGEYKRIILYLPEIEYLLD